MLFAPGDPPPLYELSVPPADMVGREAPDKRGKGERSSIQGRHLEELMW